MATHSAYRARQLRSEGKTWTAVASEAGYSSPDAARRAVRELDAEEATADRLKTAYAPAGGGGRG